MPPRLTELQQALWAASEALSHLRGQTDSPTLARILDHAAAAVLEELEEQTAHGLDPYLVAILRQCRAGNA